MQLVVLASLPNTGSFKELHSCMTLTFNAGRTSQSVNEFGSPHGKSLVTVHVDMTLLGFIDGEQKTERCFIAS